jgi:hypothetical protein
VKKIQRRLQCFLAIHDMQYVVMCVCVAAIADVSFSARVFFLAIICQILCH